MRCWERLLCSMRVRSNLAGAGTSGARLRNSNIFIPKIRMPRDKAAHHFHTFRIIEHCNCDSSLSKQVLSSKKIAVLTDDDGWNAEEQRRSCAHDARTQRAYEDELMPIATSSGVPDADDFRVCRGITLLNAQVVSTGDYTTGVVGED